jgi:type IV pilus assembly protein PilB
VDSVLAQRLARRLCEWCKAEYTPTEEELTAARWPAEGLPRPATLWKPAGCRNCANTGFRGRIALHEVMPMSSELERLTVSGAPVHELYAVAGAEGMTDLRIDGFRKAADGQTSIQEVLRVAI